VALWVSNAAIKEAKATSLTYFMVAHIRLISSTLSAVV